jgi:hypothetical protein
MSVSVKGSLFGTSRTASNIGSPQHDLRGGLRRASAQRERRQGEHQSYCLTVDGMIVRRMLNQSTDLDRLFNALADPARRAMVDG